MAEDRIVSLNLGSQQVSGAVFTKTPGGGLRLERYEKTEIVGDPSEDERRLAQSRMAVKEVAGSLKLKGSKTSYVVPSFPVLMKFASLPALDGSQVDQIVEFEAQQQVPYPINEVVWGYQLMGDPDDIEVEVILAAVKSDEINQLDEVVTDSGLKSKGAEISPVALYNALRFNYSDVQESTLLIDIGARTTDLIYMEGSKVFIRTIKIGGADVTKAIAKEFGIEYTEADQRKIADGFVALGGPYADHEDPEIAAMSKVIRNSLTRLHSEIMRTTNFFRSQQGGGAPQLALLSGSTAALPFIREFFAEKLNIPIDYFNALRNVTVAGGLDKEYLSANAHSVGDLVGSALNQMGQVPVKIDLIPDSVKKERELSKRKPALLVAVLALGALLGALGFYMNRGAEIANARAEEIRDEADTLKKYDDAIGDLKDQIATIDSQKKPYVEAVRHRAYWVTVFNYLGEKMKNDLIFITVLEPMANGLPIINDQDAGVVVSGGGASGQELKIDSFSVEGLWRENDRGSQVVYDYFKALKEDAAANPDAAVFALNEVDISEILNVEAGTNDTHYAYPWKMILPLPEANQVKFTK